MQEHRRGAGARERAGEFCHVARLSDAGDYDLSSRLEDERNGTIEIRVPGAGGGRARLRPAWPHARCLRNPAPFQLARRR